MNGYRWNGWLAAVLAAIVVAVAGAVAYNVGLSQGLAQVGASPGSVQTYGYGWHRPWGFGFLFPLMFFLFWIMFGGWWWWRRPWGPWSYYYGPPPHARDRFEEWHRQAHERMGGSGAAGKT